MLRDIKRGNLSQPKAGFSDKINIPQQLIHVVVQIAVIRL